MSRSAHRPAPGQRAPHPYQPPAAHGVTGDREIPHGEERGRRRRRPGPAARSAASPGQQGLGNAYRRGGPGRHRTRGAGPVAPYVPPPRPPRPVRALFMRPAEQRGAGTAGGPEGESAGGRAGAHGRVPVRVDGGAGRVGGVGRAVLGPDRLPVHRVRPPGGLSAYALAFGGLPPLGGRLTDVIGQRLAAVPGPAPCGLTSRHREPDADAGPAAAGPRDLRDTRATGR